MIKYTLPSFWPPLFSFSFKKYDEKGFLPYLYSSLIKIITISFKLRRVVCKSNYNSIYTFYCIFLYVNYSCNVISDRISVFPDFLSVFECLSDKLSAFRVSLSDSERLSDKFPDFRVSLTDSEHLSDKFPAFHDSLSVSERLSDKLPDFRDSLSVSERLSDKVPAFHDSLSDSKHLSDKVSRFHDILSDIRTPPLPLHRLPHLPQPTIHAQISHNLNRHISSIQYRLACHSFSPRTI